MYKKEHHLEALQLIIEDEQEESPLFTTCPLDLLEWGLLEIYGIGWEQDNV